MTNPSVGIDKNPFGNQKASQAYQAVDPVYEASAREAIAFVQPSTIGTKVRVMDVGAGTGVASEMLLQSGIDDLTLLEPSSGMLEQAKAKLGTKANYLQTTIEAIEVESIEPFDLVYALNCFHLFQNLSQALANIACILKPQGVFVFNISVPTYSFPHSTAEEKNIIQANLKFYRKLEELTQNQIVSHTVSLLEKILDNDSEMVYNKEKIKDIFAAVNLEMQDDTEVVVKVDADYQRNIWRMIAMAFAQEGKLIEDLIVGIELPGQVHIRQAVFKFVNMNKWD